jgi:hypothetical protein
MQSIKFIIADTTSAIWPTLEPLFMPPPNESKWKRTAEYILSLELAKLHRLTGWET